MDAQRALRAVDPARWLGLLAVHPLGQQSRRAEAREQSGWRRMLSTGYDEVQRSQVCKVRRLDGATYDRGQIARRSRWLATRQSKSKAASKVFARRCLRTTALIS